MRRPIVILWVGIASFLPLFGLSVSAQNSQSTPKIIISQIKITTSGQFITLYNNTGETLDLKKIQLQYFNNFDLSKATSGKLIALTGEVGPGGSVVVNDGPILMCYQSVVESVSLGLSTTSGFVQVSHFPSASGPQTTAMLDDYVGWSKTPATGSQTLPSGSDTFLQRQASTPGNYQVAAPGGGSWTVVQPDSTNPCGLVTVINGSASTVSSNLSSQLLMPGSHPPATIIRLSSSGSVMAASNRGLIAPQITELLPNPAKPQTDADDEFIEIYNSNSKNFDLSNFSLRVGSDSKRNYKFKSGTLLKPNSFTAFYSDVLTVSLTNNGGQVELLDPSGNVISRTEPYGSAKDGMAWASANGQWYWTSSPTANAANVINQATSTASSGSNSTGTASGGVRGSTTSGSGVSNSVTGSGQQTEEARLHPGVLAGVGLLAVLYGLYEYRNDVANQLNRLRRYREARRSSGAPS